MMQKYETLRKKYFTASDYNKFMNKKLDVKITKKSVNESDISGFINNCDLNKKIETLSTMAELKAKKDKRYSRCSYFDFNIYPKIKWYVNLKFYLKFTGSCLKQDKPNFTPQNRVTLFIVYNLDTW